MRILFAVHGYKPAWRLGGPIHSVSALAEELVGRGHEVIVFATNSNLDQDLDVDTECMHDVNGVQVRYFARTEPLQRALPWFRYLSQSIGLLYAPAMAGELERIVPSVDIVHTHLPFVYPTWAAGRAALRHGKPLVYHQRGVFDPMRLGFRSFKKRLYLSAVELPIARRASMLVALTEAEVASYRRLGLEAPIRVIPNGVNVSGYDAVPDPDVLASLGIGERDLVVLFLGRIHPIKGADRLLEAFLEVAPSLPSAKLVLAGPDEFQLEASFRARVNASGVAHRVIFPGMVEGGTKSTLLGRADLFVLPSAAEGFSMAILEALASATAVLISPGCYFPQVASAGAGRVVAAEVDSLAGALRDLLSDRDRLREMGLSGRRLVLERYTWSEVARQMMDSYEEVSAE